MVIYLVGGAVRDFFLEEIFKRDQATQKQFFQQIEKDWVVVGAKAEDMLANAYRPVGKSFPVFLDPINQEEYALARIERKTGKGYTGFECFTSPDVTLEEDLKRRDLTINAMALPIDGNDQIIAREEALIDPFDGYKDLQQKIFRHISPAFSEDPVRILRVARFAARWPDFTVAKETNKLMIDMVHQGEVDALTAERVWQEWLKALGEEKPLRFFAVLKECDALDILFPEFSNLQQVQKNLKVLDVAPLSEKQRFAVLLYHLQQQQIINICERYRIPNEFRDLALLVSKHYPAYLQLYQKMTAEKLMQFFEQTDALRRKDRFEEFLQVCGGLTVIEGQQKQSLFDYNEFLQYSLKIASKVDTQTLVNTGLKGPEFATKLRELRIKVLEISLLPPAGEGGRSPNEGG